jgi:ankyrin repeat protein
VCLNIRQEGRPALHLAAARGHVEVVTVLLAAGTDVETQDMVRPSRLIDESVFLMRVSHLDSTDGPPSTMLVLEAMWQW